jgi:hypothetical protein
MSARGLCFEVRYPWGTNYCRKLRAALRKLGLATGSDLLIEGSDNDGFLVGASRQALGAGQAILRKMGDADETDAALDQLRATISIQPRVPERSNPART